VAEVALTVRDLRRSVAFYREVLGLELCDASGGQALLGASDEGFLRLLKDPAAPSAAGRARLFHFAILFPSRRTLALALRRLLDARWPLSGAADHLVSEALYLSDPEGNGIELYRDRPSEQWERRDGGVRMDTLPLDLEALLAEGAGPDGPPPGVPPETRMGHVHLHLTDLAEGERFYREVVGLELMARFGSSASFLAAGGYHHHIGINTWGTAGAPRALEGAQGLRWYRLRLPTESASEEILARLVGSGLSVGREEGAIRFRDPSGHGVIVDHE
jgi:catechol 2,3-dioxygenase